MNGLKRTFIEATLGAMVLADILLTKRLLGVRAAAEYAYALGVPLWVAKHILVRP